MKRAFCILLLLLVLAPSARGQAFAFSDQVLTYTIRHNLFPGDIGTMTFRGKSVQDRYQVDASLQAAVGNIYTLECSYGTLFQKDAGLTPVSATRSQKEKKYWAKGIYDWSAPGVVHMDVTKSTRVPRDETLNWHGTVRDLLGMIWWLRSRDYGRESLDVPNALLLDHDALPVRVTFNRKEIRYGGKQTPVIEVTVAQDGKDALRLTLSDNAQRIPLKFSIGLPFGTIKGSLAR